MSNKQCISEGSFNHRNHSRKRLPALLADS